MFESSLRVDENRWCQSLKKYYSFEGDELNNLLQGGIAKNKSQHIQSEVKSLTANKKFSKSLPGGRLFAVTARNLKDND